MLDKTSIQGRASTFVSYGRDTLADLSGALDAAEAEAAAVLARADKVDAVLRPALCVLLSPGFRAAVASLEPMARCNEHIALCADDPSTCIEAFVTKRTLRKFSLLPTKDDGCMQRLSNYLLDLPDTISWLRYRGPHGASAVMEPPSLSATLRYMGLFLQQRYARATRVTFDAHPHLFVPTGVWTTEAHALLATPEFFASTKELLLVFRAGSHAWHLPVHLAHDVVRRAYDAAVGAQRGERGGPCACRRQLVSSACPLLKCATCCKNTARGPRCARHKAR